MNLRELSHRLFLPSSGAGLPARWASSWARRQSRSAAETRIPSPRARPLYLRRRLARSPCTSGNNGAVAPRDATFPDGGGIPASLLVAGLVYSLGEHSVHRAGHQPNGAESGRYGNGSPKENAQGLVGIPCGGTAHHMAGCDPKVEYEIPMQPGSFSGEKKAGAPFSPPQSWIALVAHGGCLLKDKVANAARRKAAAVVIYNEPQFGNSTLTSMSYLGTANIVVIMVGYPKGMEILEPVLRGIPVKMTISVGKQHVQEYINGQSVVFVAIAFITMMIISLAWLIFFYVQRFLYTGSQFRSQGQREETISAIAQLPLCILKDEDKCWAIDAENCAICIENYKAKDTVRLLPCKHIFHKLCIDPWLLEQRTCPMCKLDIMKALGYWGESKKVAVPESISNNIPTENWNISIEEDSNETSGLSASSISSVTLNNVLKENLCETTILLELDSGDNQHDHLPSVSLQI